MLSKQIPLGIYEKALPAGECWLERLQLAKTLGFDFVEMSVDETDDRLSRLNWSREQRLALVNAIVETGVRVPSMCLSAHRRFPLGSEDDAVRAGDLYLGQRQRYRPRTRAGGDQAQRRCLRNHESGRYGGG